MEELLQKINESCTKYKNKELDDTGFRKIIEEIPSDLWQEKDSALAIVKELIENEDLYDISSKPYCPFAEFICRLLPESLFESPDCVTGIAEIILDFEASFFDEGASCDAVDTVFSFMPQSMWEDDQFVTAAANFVIERASSMYDLNCISDVIPESVWKNENELSWLVRRLYNEDERNMNKLYLFPQKCWESSAVILEILSCLQDAIENDRAWGTAYCNFRASDEEYFREFLDYVPDEFKSDSDFVVGVLGHQDFWNSFEVLYDWMDEKLWADKEFVLAALKNDEETPVEKMTKEFLSDKEFMSELEEIFDVCRLGCEYLDDDDDRGIPCIVYAAEQGDKKAQTELNEMKLSPDKAEKIKEAENLFKAAEKE